MIRDVFYYGAKPNVHPRERPARDLADARRLCTTEHFWIVNRFCDYTGFDWDFDFEFLPDEDVWAEHHNNVWPSQHQKDSGTWLCSKEDSDIIIYRTDVEPVQRINQPHDHWVIVDHSLDFDKFDFSWHPDPAAPPYEYRWGCKFFPVELHTVVLYRVPDAAEISFMNETVELLPEWSRWTETQPVDHAKFDFSWRPDPYEPPYIYVWGNKHIAGELKPTLTYAVPGATAVKYMPEHIAVVPEWDRWSEVQGTSNFDFTWRPDPREPPFIYVWGNRHVPGTITPTVQYTVPGATQVKFMHDLVEVQPQWNRWVIPHGIDVGGFDFTWRPNPTSPPVIYQFGTLEDPEDGPKYLTPNHSNEVVRLERVKVKNPGFPRYYVDTTLDDLVQKHPTEIFWALNKALDYSTFDFDWRPSIEQAEYVHAFGSSSSELTQTYLVNAVMWQKGRRDINWVEDKSLDDNTLYNLFQKPDMFFVDRGNSRTQAKYQKLLARFPHIQKTRYLNSWVDTIGRCANKSSTELFWVLNSELDYTDFDFEYYPNPWQMKMVNVFGTQWSHWGNTYLVNKNTFAEDTKYVKVIEHLNVLNFVKNRRARATECLYDLFIIDHGNGVERMKYIHGKVGNRSVDTIAYRESYLETFKDILSRIENRKEHYLWVCSSICDYDDFDFSYICDPYAKEQLHVFPSDGQKFGDTFLINVNKLRELITDMTTLEEYEKINFNQHQRVYRAEEPLIYNDEFSFAELTKQYIWRFPYVTIVDRCNQYNLSFETMPKAEPMCLWSPDTKNIIVHSTGASKVTVPREASEMIKDELYDYPHIKRVPKLAKSMPLDIIFISNGELNADENYASLYNSIASQNSANHIERISGINGRVAAYHAAAGASMTPWFFAVFAKLEINPNFNWDWQPDRLQAFKHYIFHAKNPVNGLIYGHQAMIAYHKDTVLENDGYGLDFTLDDKHEVVPLMSGTAKYNVDPFTAWRTAFREAIKLRDENSPISLERLDAWLTKGEGQYGEYSIKGAQDAIAYYDSVSGDFDSLRLSYEWAWLRDQFNSRT